MVYNTFGFLLLQLSETQDYDEKKKIRLALRQLRQQTRGKETLFKLYKGNINL